jgi:hypothetical protein
MTLAELCEPFFEYVCRLNRTARKGGDVPESSIRSELLRLLADLKTKSQAESKLHEQYLKVELPLIFFADSLISESRLKCAGMWNKNRMAYDRKELAGDEKFFDLLEETLQDPSADATERLKIFYTGLGLGFTGWYAGQIDYLKRKQKELAARIGVNTSPEAKGKIVPEAYENLDTRNLIEPPVAKMAGLSLLLGGLTVLMLGLNVMIFRQHSRDLADRLATIASFEKLMLNQPLEQKSAEATEEELLEEEMLEEEEVDDLDDAPPSRRSAARRRAAADDEQP